MQAPKTQPRVAFGTLVENGYVKPGAVLFDAKRRWKATVRVDGSLEAEGDTGSIHKLGATLQNAPSCNGWTFWHYEDGEKLKPIDAVRQTYILARSEEHTSELQSLMRISYAVFCLKKKNNQKSRTTRH